MAFMYTPFNQLGPPWDIPAALPLIPQAIFALPFADFNFYHIEDSPPDGWGVPRSKFSFLLSIFMRPGEKMTANSNLFQATSTIN